MVNGELGTTGDVQEGSRALRSQTPYTIKMALATGGYVEVEMMLLRRPLGAIGTALTKSEAKPQ